MGLPVELVWPGVGFLLLEAGEDCSSDLKVGVALNTGAGFPGLGEATCFFASSQEMWSCRGRSP